MSNRNLSINQRLGKTRRIDVKRQILHDWVDNLDRDIDSELRTIGMLAGRRGQNPEIGCAIIRLQMIRSKFIPALNRIIAKIEAMQ